MTAGRAASERGQTPDPTGMASPSSLSTRGSAREGQACVRNVQAGLSDLVADAVS